MKRFAPNPLILVALILLIAIPIYRSLAQVPAAKPTLATAPATAPKPDAAKWEYAELIIGDKDSEEVSTFAAPDFYKEERSIDQLYEDLGGTPKIIKHLPAWSELRVDLLNQIGSDGWELVSVTPEVSIMGPDPRAAGKVKNPFPNRLYIFKRPTAK